MVNKSLVSEMYVFRYEPSGMKSPTSASTSIFVAPAMPAAVMAQKVARTAILVEKLPSVTPRPWPKNF